MAVSGSSSPARISYQKLPPISIGTSIPLLPSSSSSSITTSNFFAPCPQSFSPIHLSRPHRHFRTLPCRVASPGPPPPEHDPGDDKSSLQPTGIVATLSRFYDTVRIFFAVFFWMSLFFWSSTWEGGNDDKPDKGSRFGR